MKVQHQRILELQGWNLFFYRGKPKIAYISEDKTLLTLVFFILESDIFLKSLIYLKTYFI